jgi:hypothetical protein
MNALDSNGSLDELGTDRDGRRSDEAAAPHEIDLLQQQLPGWGSPIGLGLGLLSAGAVVELPAEELAIRSSLN